MAENANLIGENLVRNICEAKLGQHLLYLISDDSTRQHLFEAIVETGHDIFEAESSLRNDTTAQAAVLQQETDIFLAGAGLVTQLIDEEKM